MSHLYDDFGRLVLRLTLGGLMLFHGFSKLGSGSSLNWIGGQLSAAGLPEFLAYGVYVGEIVAPLMIIAGVVGLLLNLFYSSQAEVRAIPAFLKFTNANGIPPGLVFFFLFVFSAIKLFENKRPWLWAMVLLVHQMSSTF